MLDKSKGLVLSNELVTNGDFSAGATGWTVTNNDATHIATFSGGTLRYQSDTTTPLLNVGQAGLLSANKTFLVTVVCSAWTSGSVKVAESTLGMLIVNGVGTFTARVSTAILTSLNIQRNSTNVDLTLDSISVREIAGNHAYQTTSASRPILRQNAVTGANYLEFDGSDDFLVTNNIDFTTTDKVSLFAGVRKLSDVSVASVFCLTETPTSSQGTFELYTPQTNGGEGLSYYSRGATIKSTIITTGFKSPSSFVLSAKTDISSNSTTVKINSSIFPPAGTGLGGGYFGDHPLYIGRRGGVNLPLNGHIYGLIGIGKLVSDSETAAIEKELAKRAGVTL
jgi:hypothetical protein